MVSIGAYSYLKAQSALRHDHYGRAARDKLASEHSAFRHFLTAKGGADDELVIFSFVVVVDQLVLAEFCHDPVGSDVHCLRCVVHILATWQHVVLLQRGSVVMRLSDWLQLILPPTYRSLAQAHKEEGLAQPGLQLQDGTALSDENLLGGGSVA